MMARILRCIVIVSLQLLLFYKGSWVAGHSTPNKNIHHNDLFDNSTLITNHQKPVVTVYENRFLQNHPFRLQTHPNNIWHRFRPIIEYRSREKKRTAYDVIKELGATEFLRLASIVHLDSILKNPNSNVTVFAPTNKAMMAVSPNLCSNLTSMMMIIRFHIAKGFVKFPTVTQNGMLTTFAKYSGNTMRYRLKIRTNIYIINNSKIFSVSGAKIVKANQKGNGTIVHLIDKALFPLPVECAYNTIFQHPDFSILRKFIQKSFTLLRVLCDSRRNLTFFAPTDEAFKKLSVDVFRKLQNDVVLLTQVFVKHIASDVYYSVGISGHHSIKGVPNNRILLRKVQNKFLVTVDKVTGKFSIPDISVTNGVIHGIDTVLYDSDPNSSIDIIG